MYYIMYNYLFDLFGFVGLTHCCRKRILATMKAKSRTQMTNLPIRRFLVEPGMFGSLKDR